MKKQFTKKIAIMSGYMIVGAFLQCVFISLLFAEDTHAQKQSLDNVHINLQVEGSVTDVFKAIEQTTDFYFSLNHKRINDDKRIQINVRNKSLKHILEELSKEFDLEFMRINQNIHVSKLKNKDIRVSEDLVFQAIKVTGIVTDESGSGLPGVNVVIKGNNQGTVTDVEGNYSIDVPSQETVLIFSSVGYVTEEMLVGNQTVINMSMVPDITSLEEIVVIGYGTQKKVTVTGSVVTTEGTELVKSRTPNVLNSMAGHLPGLIINNRSGEPGRDEPNIFIRGRSTTGDASPLVIIDGVQRSDLGRLNPNDIESISVLKDASAAIYGARAANGVILVTTKRGQKGKPVFNFSYNQGFSQPTRNPKMADSYTFAKVYNEIELDAGRTAPFSDDDLRRYQDGTDPTYPSTDWYKEMTRTLTPQSQMSLSVAGGTDAVDYYISLGSLSQQGHFNHGSHKVNRYNFRSNLGVKVSDYLRIGLDLSGRLDDKHYPGNPDTRGIYSHIYLYQPNWTLFWPGTDYLRPNRDNESLVNWVSDAGGTQDDLYKAIESRLHFQLDIPWVSGLSIRGSANYDAGYNHLKYWNLPTYVHYYDEGTGEYTRGRSGAGADLAQLTEHFFQRTMTTLNSQINYDKSIGKHTLGIMVGVEQIQYDDNFFETLGTDFPATALPQFSAGSSDRQKYTTDGSAGIASRLNYFGRATYDYDNKYLLQLIFRYDGSPIFPENKRWGFFPGVSAGWRVSEEAFMEGLDFIDDLKIRGSYGQMGNDSVAQFQFLSTYDFNSAFNYVVGGNDVVGVVPGPTSNPNITWEVAKITNIGFELSLWKGLLGFEFDYFITRRSNVLTPNTAIVPDYRGIVLPDQNIGVVENKGFEIQALHRRNFNKFSYSIRGNMSFARNKVVVTNEVPGVENYQLKAGKPIGAETYYQAEGIFATQEEVDSRPTLPGARPGDIIYKDVNGDGVLNSRDMVRLDRTATPEIVYGLNINLQYGSFDMSILFQGQENAVAAFHGTDNYFPVMNYNLGNFLQWRADGRWSAENTNNATMPRGAAENANNNTQRSTQWLVDAGFLRLKNLEIGYTLPQSLSQRVGMQYVRAYVSANNLAIIYDHMKDLGFDPETADYWFYPQQRTFNVGVNLTF